MVPPWLGKVLLQARICMTNIDEMLRFTPDFQRLREVSESSRLTKPGTKQVVVQANRSLTLAIVALASFLVGSLHCIQIIFINPVRSLE